MSEVLKQFQNKLEERNKPIDTTLLQRASLIRFARTLGYEGVKTAGHGFTNIKYFNHFISFNDMVRLHNNCLTSISFLPKVVMDGRFPCHSKLMAAARSRLVSRVKLQRKGKGIIVQNHMVKLNTVDEKAYKLSKLFQACPTLSTEQADQLIKAGMEVL